MVLDEEGDLASAEVPGAGESTTTAGPLASAEPEMERTPPLDRRGEPTAEMPGRGGEAAGKKGEGSGSSSRRPLRAYIRPRSEGAQEQTVRPAPTLTTMSDAGEAACLLQGLRTTASKEEMRALSHSALLDSVMVTVVQMGNGIMSLREAIAHNSNALSKAIMRADRYKKESLTYAQSLAHLHQEAKDREEGLGSRVREAEKRADVESGQASAAETELRRVSSQLEEIRSQKEELANRLQGAAEEIKAASEEAGASMERAVAADKAMVEVIHERAGAVAHADDAGARIEEAENRAWEAGERVREAERRAEEAERRAEEAGRRAEEAERKSQRAEAEARRAVADFKASPDFSKEVLEASLDAYVQGFESCKAKATAALKIDASKLEEIRPGGPDEEPSGDREEDVPGQA